MAVFEIKAELAPEIVPLVEELLADRQEQRLLVLEDKPSTRAWLAGYFDGARHARAAWAQLAGGFGPGWLLAAPSVKELPDQDWKESYKAHFKAWQFGRLHWVPLWERDRFHPPAGHQVLWLDPGMAFGTGNHETTRLVVERLVSLREAQGPDGDVIDAGCGSGILALSAARLGFGAIAAFDNDPVAVEVSRGNAALNDLAGRVDFFEGDLRSGLAGRRAAVVLANIQADVLVAHARELLGAIAPRGALVLSGILAAELAQVRKAFGALGGDASMESNTLGEWSDLVVTRH